MALQRQRSGAQPYTDVRLTVNIADRNINTPSFEGKDPNGRYSTALSDQTTIDQTILTIVAVDLDGLAPNNEVGIQ